MPFKDPEAARINRAKHASKNNERAKLWYASNKERASARTKVYNAEHKERLAKQHKEYYSVPENKEVIKQRAAAAYLRNKDKIRERGRLRNRNSYWIRLGLEPQYDVLFEKQRGCCAICNTHQNGLKKDLAVDHDHGPSGKVRGLLCNNCNAGLGMFRDNSALINRAIEYLAGEPCTAT